MRSSYCDSVWMNPTSIHEDAGSIPGLSGLRIQCCPELPCRSQLQLGSGIAVAVAYASSCSTYSAPSLGTSICCGCGPKKDKTNKQTRWIVHFKWKNCVVYELSLSKAVIKTTSTSTRGLRVGNKRANRDLKNKAGGFTLPDIKIHLRLGIEDYLRHWHKDK